MADNKKVQEEDLKKLEDQAYFELCQIIAEAMQLQDVDLLNARIASWKNKYKKLLDRPSTNSKSDFKKRIEYLLTQYYSEVTKYILSQLKLNEEKKVENQAKALTELYRIIKETNDYDLLKSKVDKWKEKYPVSGFLKMYQKRIELYSRDKSLRENSFKQEEAFRDLVDVTKVHGTLDELKNELALWEEKYSINNKYTIDDFLNHQTEVKRFTSDEFLQSIAREEFQEDKSVAMPDDTVQSKAYAALLKISTSTNSVNEMFTWVYKNRFIKFSDKYKDLILANPSIHLNYSPAYLKKLTKPKIDMSKSSLSYDEYLNIIDIKRYAIISYFNLLLPPEEAISNDYFNKHIETIYSKSEKARLTNIKEDSTFIEENSSPELTEPLAKQTEENIDSHIHEVSLEQQKDSTSPQESSNKPDTTIESLEIIDNTEPKVNLEIEKTETVESFKPVLPFENTDSKDIENKDLETDTERKTETPVVKIDLEPNNINNSDQFVDIEPEEKQIDSTQTSGISESEPVLDLSDFNEGITIEFKKEPIDSMTLSVETTESENYNTNTMEEDSLESDTTLDYSYTTEEPLTHETIVAFSPLFFNQINNYSTQAILVKHIDSSVSEYVEKEKSKEALLDESIKLKTDE